VDEAILHFQKALETQPNDVRVYNNLGAAFLSQKGQIDQAINCYQKILDIQPDSAIARRNLCQVAWILATSPDASVRNGAKAIELAKQTVRLSDGADPISVRTLAAADAEAGRFSEAAETAQQAQRLAAALNNTALVNELQVQIQLYQAGSPFRDASLTNIPAKPGPP
jgi:tetratricopeptide (TPR) repeat protein